MLVDQWLSFVPGPNLSNEDCSLSTGMKNYAKLHDSGAKYMEAGGATADTNYHVPYVPNKSQLPRKRG